MNDKRPSTEPPSERQLSRQLGISRAALWRAKKVAEIPEDEFEALIERDNPATVTQLVAYSHKRATPATGALRRAWNAATEIERADFLSWLKAKK